MSKTNTESFTSLAAFIWSVVDTLRGDFKQSEHGVVVFAGCCQLESALEATRLAVVDKGKI